MGDEFDRFHFKWFHYEPSLCLVNNSVLIGIENEMFDSYKMKIDSYRHSEIKIWSGLWHHTVMSPLIDIAPFTTDFKH